MPKKTLQERGVVATKAYLDNVGIKNVSLVEPSTLRGEEGDKVVVVFVRAQRTPTDKKITKSWLNRMRRKVSPDRYDFVSILVLAEDRALLRHHRDVDKMYAIR